MINHETISSIFSDYQINPDHTSASLETLAAADSRTLRDLKLNVNNVLSGTNMSRKEALLLALSIASNEKNETLIKSFEQLAKNEGGSDAEVAEVHACVIVMNANNVFYRFKHFMEGNEYYTNTPAGLRMSVMMNPVVGKEFFELMSLVISAVNGCERCVTSHENSVKQHGASEARIYDAIRLGAVIKSFCTVI